MKIAALTLGILAIAAPAVEAGERLNGAGASFPAPIYQKSVSYTHLTLPTTVIV